MSESLSLPVNPTVTMDAGNLRQAYARMVWVALHVDLPLTRHTSQRHLVFLEI